MIVGIAFWIMTLSSCMYATMHGGTDGRAAAALILSASLLSLPVEFGSRWGHTDLSLLAIDTLLLVGLCALALRSNRFFVLWMAGFHLVAVASHLSTIVAPDVAPKIYRALSSLWAIPMSLVMWLGIRADRRSGLFERASPRPHLGAWR